MSRTVTLQLSVNVKWWMRPALWLSALALRSGLVRDMASDEHFGGIITAQERVAKWLADYAFRISAK